MPLLPKETMSESCKMTEGNSLNNNEYSDMDILECICPKKLGITEVEINTYSKSLSGKVRVLFDELNPAQKNNVIAFSMISPSIVNHLEKHPHYMPGIHSKDVAFLIRIHKACEECIQTNSEVNKILTLKVVTD